MMQESHDTRSPSKGRGAQWNWELKQFGNYFELINKVLLQTNNFSCPDIYQKIDDSYRVQTQSGAASKSAIFDVIAFKTSN